MARNSMGDLRRLAEIEQLFRRALELSRAAVESDLDTLGPLLAERDCIFSRTNDLCRSFTADRDETIDLDGFDADHKPEAVRLADSTRRLTEELALLDMDLKSRLERDRMETRDKIGEIALGRHRLRAYAPFARASAQIFQRRG